MITVALTFAFACFGLGIVMCVVRIARGENAADRILALDTIVINVIALLILYGILKSTAVYYEASMLVAMVGFVSTVAYCRFVLRGDIIE